MGRHKWLGLLMCCALGGAAASPAFAAIYTLSDLNSSTAFDLGSPAAHSSWVVDGQSHLDQERFSYQIGSGSKLALDSIGTPQVRQLDANFNPGDDTIFVRYTAKDFEVDLGFVLTGGSLGSYRSDIATTISVRNTSTSVLPFHFYDYADFDLNGSPLNDSVAFVSVNVVRQTKGAISLVETVFTPGTTSQVLEPSPIGDAAWTLEWFANINPGQTLLISKDQMLITSIPEPATCLLLLFSVGLLRRRKSRG